MTLKVVKLDFPDRDLYILAGGDWAGFRSTACAKEPDTVEWIRSFDPESVFWDVGASVGPYSLIAASLGHTVVAFEPFLPSVGHLQQNAWLNKFDIQVFPIGLGEMNTIVEMGVRDTRPGAGAHGMVESVASQTMLQFRANEMSTDWPDYVKIDVDGPEIGVVEGGREVWKGVKSLLVESDPEGIDDIAVILNGCGLHLESSQKRIGDTQQRNYLFRRSE